MRLVLATCLALSPAAALAANPDCTVFGEIADAVAVERANGKAMNDAMLAVAEDYKGSKERFRPTIPLLADWVYTLPADQLDEGVGAAYRQACEAQ